MNVPLWHIEVVLPIGISFYTFQSMSYVIDVYRKDIKPTRNFLEFATFVSFFPHLVAGPIMRPTTCCRRSSRPRNSTSSSSTRVLPDLLGPDQEVVVADNLAPIVNDLFGRWQTIDGGLALLAIYAFAFQIYCDFSGTPTPPGASPSAWGSSWRWTSTCLFRHQPAGFLGPMAHQPVVAERAKQQPRPNTAGGHDKWSPLATSATAKKTIENGNPNRKRILVAPQVPSGPVNERCIALRATCPSAAVMVKGIQRRGDGEHQGDLGLPAGNRGPP